MQDQGWAEAAHKEFHFLGEAAEEIDDGAHAGIDGRDRKGEIGAERKTEQANAARVDFRPSFHVSDGIPDGLAPGGKVSDRGLLVGQASGAGAIEVVRHEHGKAVLGKRGSRVGHRGMSASGAVETDHGRKPAAVF